jgi:hypothetical protein
MTCRISGKLEDIVLKLISFQKIIFECEFFEDDKMLLLKKLKMETCEIWVLYSLDDS